MQTEKYKYNFLVNFKKCCWQQVSNPKFMFKKWKHNILSQQQYAGICFWEIGIILAIWFIPCARNNSDKQRLEGVLLGIHIEF